MTTTTVAPGRRDRLAFIKDHGTAMVVLAGGHLWLLPVMLPGTPHGEMISWSALGIAFGGGVVLGWQRLQGWRVWAATGALAVLGAMLAVLLLESAGLLGDAVKPDLSETTYREVRGDGACGTSSCSGHEAGWAWAERNHVFDPDDCGGKSWSFEEGCRAWAEEQSGG